MYFCSFVGIYRFDGLTFLAFCRSGFNLDGLGMEILSIALPATLALAADPIASLVDTAYVGHLGIFSFNIG